MGRLGAERKVHAKKGSHKKKKHKHPENTRKEKRGKGGGKEFSVGVRGFEEEAVL